MQRCCWTATGWLNMSGMQQGQSSGVKCQVGNVWQVGAPDCFSSRGSGWGNIHGGEGRIRRLAIRSVGSTGGPGVRGKRGGRLATKSTQVAWLHGSGVQACMHNHAITGSGTVWAGLGPAGEICGWQAEWLGVAAGQTRKLLWCWPRLQACSPSASESGSSSCSHCITAGRIIRGTRQRGEQQS